MQYSSVDYFIKKILKLSLTGVDGANTNERKLNL